MLILNRRQQFLVNQWFGKHRTKINRASFNSGSIFHYGRGDYDAVARLWDGARYSYYREEHITPGINQLVRLLYDTYQEAHGKENCNAVK